MLLTASLTGLMEGNYIKDSKGGAVRVDNGNGTIRIWRLLRRGCGTKIDSEWQFLCSRVFLLPQQIGLKTMDTLPKTSLQFSAIPEEDVVLYAPFQTMRPKGRWEDVLQTSKIT